MTTLIIFLIVLVGSELLRPAPDFEDARCPRPNMKPIYSSVRTGLFSKATYISGYEDGPCAPMPEADLSLDDENPYRWR